MKGDILFSFYEVSITEQGVKNGTLVAYKFFLVMVSGILFASTTRTSSLKNAVQWFLQPVPYIPEKRVAVMISLSIGFMPIILNQAKEISQAQEARCADLQKNPIKKIIRLVLPLLKKTFLSANHLILAMESRCYNDDRTEPYFSPSGREIHFIVASIILSLGLAWF